MRPCLEIRSVEVRLSMHGLQESARLSPFFIAYDQLRTFRGAFLAAHSEPMTRLMAMQSSLTRSFHPESLNLSSLHPKGADIYKGRSACFVQLFSASETMYDARSFAYKKARGRLAPYCQSQCVNEKQVGQVTSCMRGASAFRADHHSQDETHLQCPRCPDHRHRSLYLRDRYRFPANRRRTRTPLR